MKSTMISSPLLFDSRLERAGRLSLNLRLHPDELASIANHAGGSFPHR